MNNVWQLSVVLVRGFGKSETKLDARLLGNVAMLSTLIPYFLL